jgi:predicted ArsR family transcriptional regulator
MNKGLKKIFSYWFSGFESGLENIDSRYRNRLLRYCGEACADSYTKDMFRQAKAKSPDLAQFLKNLSKKLPDAEYEMVSSNVIRVIYNRCGCDIVSRGFIKSPLFCRCSVANLKANFQYALGKAVVVELEASILGGADRCLFQVKIL